jgi:(1->4)-alpha-D-glucan 1-alpha-D-glucosylmutase
VCNGLLVYDNGLKEMTEIYRDFSNETVDFETLAHEKKLNVELAALGSDVNRLTGLFLEICENNRDRRDYTREEIRRALREVAACFPVYRSYVVPERDQITNEDRVLIDQAVLEARKRTNDHEPGILDFIGDVLALRSRGGLETEFLLRFQQFTSPVMAKGVEDTAFYCFNRMIGLNEVGGAPDRNGLTIAQFHEYCTKMQATHPQTMTTLSTHDTKRAEDVRARLAAITEIPGRWRVAVNRWSRMNATFRTGNYPDRNSEYFLYQTMLGAWPISKDRLTAYMEKAMREAKQQTSWTQPNKDFEDALKTFIERILNTPEFVSELERFVGRVLQAGRINSLAQTLLKYTAPGVPDTYQGSELWDLSLVDPDNRRPVDYDLRRGMVSALERGMDVDQVMRRMDIGMPKLYVVHKALRLRREHPEWFGTEAAYIPIAVEGSKIDHLIAYLRGDSVAVIVPRWPRRLGSNWSATSLDLPPGKWTNIFTGDAVSGGRQRVGPLLRRFPVALLKREAE